MLREGQCICAPSPNLRCQQSGWSGVLQESVVAIHKVSKLYFSSTVSVDLRLAVGRGLYTGDELCRRRFSSRLGVKEAALQKI
jgi:hypothetical protein